MVTHRACLGSGATFGSETRHSGHDERALKGQKRRWGARGERLGVSANKKMGLAPAQAGAAAPHLQIRCQSSADVS